MKRLRFSNLFVPRIWNATIWLTCLLASIGLAGTPSGSVVRMASLPSQPVAANDLLSVTILHADELSVDIRLDPDGNIHLPMLSNPVAAAGLKPTELELVIRKMYVESGILVNPVISVKVLEYASRPVSVIGAVRNPVTFQAEREISLLEALTRAGGLSEDAGSYLLLTSVSDDEEQALLTQRIPIAEILESASAVGAIRLRGGQEIRVPEAGEIFVVGNVKKPGTYRVPDDDQTSVLKALALSEGLLPNSTDEAYIYRPLEDGSKIEIPVNLKKLLARKSADVSLLRNDVLYVPESSKKKATMSAIERALAFGSATLSGVLVWGLAR